MWTIWQREAVQLIGGGFYKHNMAVSFSLMTTDRVLNGVNCIRRQFSLSQLDVRGQYDMAYDVLRGITHSSHSQPHHAAPSDRATSIRPAQDNL